MKKMRRLLSLVVAIVMVMALAVTASASTDPDAPTQMMMPQGTLNVPANTTMYFYYQNWMAAATQDLTVTGPTGFSVWTAIPGETTDDNNGSVNVKINAAMMGMFRFSITNNTDTAADYSVKLAEPLGTYNNPDTLSVTANAGTAMTATTDGTYGGYTYVWNATADGIITVAVNGTGWTYDVNYSGQHYSDDNPVVPSTSVEVKAGDVVNVWVNTYDATNMMDMNPAGTVSFTVYFCEGGHTEVTDAAVPATCTTPGKTEGKHCSVCNTVTVAQEDTELAAHTPETDAAVPATCTTPGLTEGSHCSVCKEVLVAQEETELAAHTPETDAAVPATCIATGLTEGSHCSVCKEVLVAQEETPKAAHTLDDGTVTKEATCTAKGETTYACTVEGCDHTETKANIEKLAHVDEDKNSLCDVCKADLSNPSTGDASMVWFVLMTVSAMALAAVVVLNKKVRRV